MRCEWCSNRPNTSLCGGCAHNRRTIRLFKNKNAEQVKTLVAQRDRILSQEREIERWREVIANIAASHPGTPVCFERDGQICYQELSNWADYVLGGGYSRAIPPPGDDCCETRPYGGGPPTEPPKGDKPRGYA